MASHTSLGSLFSDIADAIRSKTGSSATIKADDFPEAISNIHAGSGTDTSDATLETSRQLLSGITAYSKGSKYTGSMPNNEAEEHTIDGIVNTSFYIPWGYHDGGGSVSLDDTIENLLSEL